MQVHVLRFTRRLLKLVGLYVLFLSLPLVFAQSFQVRAEWALFDQILVIGIIVGLVVFGLLFYAIIRFREKPQKAGAK